MPLISKEKAQALKTLGLGYDATQDDIRSAWKRLAFEKHPDRNTGSHDELTAINTAYSELRNEGAYTAPAHQRRPALRTQTVDISPDAEAICQSVLDKVNADLAPGEVSEDTKVGRADHVPCSLRRRGRNLSYIIRTPLEEGSNRVALPTGALEHSRKVTPKVMTFNSTESGTGKVEVPEDIRATLFPGARSVRIHFGQD